MIVAILSMSCHSTGGRDASDRLLPEPAEPQWVEHQAAAGGRRKALIIAAGEYQVANWRISYAVPSAHRLADVLTSRLGYSTKDTVILADRAVTPSGVKVEIDKMTSALSSPTDSLLVMWIGHGFEIGGQQQFLTHTTVEEGDAYTNTVLYADVVQWLSDAKRESGFSTALVIDACRTRSSAAPKRVNPHVSLIDVAAFSAEPGRSAEAEADDEISLFTGALCDALDVPPGQRVTLRPALETAARRCASQGAVITTPRGKDITLLDRANLTVSIRAVDFRTKSTISSATVLLNGVEQQGVARYTGLGESPEGYDLNVRAPGYLPRTLALPLPRERSGHEVLIELLPEAVVVQGMVQLEGSGSLRVKMLGELRGVVDEYHQTSTILADSGTFTLKLPMWSGSRDMVMESGGEILRRIKVSAQDSSEVRHISDSLVRVVNIGTQVVSLRNVSVQVGGSRQAELIEGIDIEFDFPELSEADFGEDAKAWSLYTQALVLAEADQFGSAAGDLGQLLSKKRLPSRAVSQARSLVEELRVADRLDRASSFQRAGRLDAAIDALQGTGGEALDRRIRPVLASWLQTSARQLHESGDYDGAASSLDRCMRLDVYDEDDLAAQLVRVREDQVAAAFDQAVADGQWEPVKGAIDKLSTLKDVERWLEHVEREAISPLCREHYAEGTERLLEGEHEAARWSFREAKKSGCNEHYRKLILDQERVIADTLFDRYSRSGAERLAAGDKVGAAHFFAMAMEFDPDLVAHRLETLLEDPDVRTLVPEATAAMRTYRKPAAPSKQTRGASTEKSQKVTASTHPEIKGVRHVGVNSQGQDEYELDLPGRVAMRFVLVPAGSYSIDGPNGTRTEVRVAAYLIQKTECTQRQWVAVEGDNPSEYRGAGLDAPVDNVSWMDVQRFARSLGLRLPTETEWACAATPGSEGLLPIRFDPSDGPEAALSGLPNALGLYGTHHNLREWCLDSWHVSMFEVPANGRAFQDASTSFKVVRGSSTPASDQGWGGTDKVFRACRACRDLGLGEKYQRNCPTCTPIPIARTGQSRHSVPWRDKAPSYRGQPDIGFRLARSID